MVDYKGKICESAKSKGYFYKTDLPLTVDKNFEECYYWMHSDFESVYKGDFPLFTMDNFYYMTNEII